MLFYSEHTSPRLVYILDLIGNEILSEPIRLISDRGAYKNYSEPKINYSSDRISGEEYFIRPHPLIFETGIREQSITCFDFNGRPAFFKTDGDFPFDLFSAAFYLLSRY